MLLEVLVLILLTGAPLAMMAKKRRRRFNLRRVRFASSVSAGALATLDVVAGNVSAATTNEVRIVTVDASYSWTGKTDIDDGCEFGLFHSDYSAAEVEECLESQASMDLGDKVAQEQANRLVRVIGMINATNDAAAGGSSFNGGQRVKTKLNWLMTEGDTLALFIRNASGVVWTTGSSVSMIGDLWVKD